MKSFTYPIIILIGLLSGLFSFVFAALQQSDFNPEEFGLGRNTFTKIAYKENFAISGLPDTLDPVNRHFRKLRKTEQSVAIWLGASQLHAINPLTEGDKLAVEYANAAADNRGANLAYLQTSTPNANFHDLLTMYQLFRQEGLFPDWLIIAAVYDDLREKGMQVSLLKQLKEIPDETIDSGGKGIKDVLDEWLLVKREADSPTRGTPHERLEKWLVSNLENTLPGYKYRGRLIAQTSISIQTFLLNLRTQFITKTGFRKTRVPKIPKHLIAWNNEALEALIKLALHDRCKMLIYKQPHRPSEEQFYHNREKYDAYFDELSKKCRELKNVYYLDLEIIVPEQYWGVTNSGRPDVFHFRDEAHYLLGKSIDEHIAELSVKGKNAVQ